MARASDTEPSDEALLAGMALGDQRAGVALVRRYQRRLFGLAFSMVGDATLAEDIAQEAFLRAWRHAVVFDGRRAAVSTWLLTITRNLAVDALRLRRPVVTDPTDAFWAGLASGAPLTEERVEQADTRDRMASALSRLPAEQCRAVVLAAVYGFTAVEVSERESVPLGTAKTRIRRGLQKLRALTGAGPAPAGTAWVDLTERATGPGSAGGWPRPGQSGSGPDVEET